jgi:hypothetical protein
MKFVGEERDQVTEHVTRAGEAVQQQKLRRICWPLSLSKTQIRQY